MLSITESAWDRLAQLQSARTNVRAIRLSLAEGKLKCHRGSARECDRMIDRPGHPTLLMTPTVAKDLSDRILDTATTERGPRLRLSDSAH